VPGADCQLWLTARDLRYPWASRFGKLRWHFLRRTFPKWKLTGEKRLPMLQVIADYLLPLQRDTLARKSSNLFGFSLAYRIFASSQNAIIK
jgi:hypothetical protein